MRSRVGGSLLELVIVIAIAAALMGIAVPPIAAAVDRASVHAAADDAASVFAVARDEALVYHAPVTVLIDSTSGTMVVHAPGRGTWPRPLGSLYGVVVRATRDSMRYDARGLGLGAANLTLVIVRGRARDSLFVSRLGRVRH